MVDNAVKQLVDRYIYQDRGGGLSHVDEAGLQWVKQWLEGEHSESAYNQLSNWANRYYTEQEQQRVAQAQNVTQQQQDTNQNFNSLIGQLNQQVTQQQQNTNDQFNAQFQALQTQQNQAYQQLAQQNAQQQQYYQSLIAELQKPRYQNFNPQLYDVNFENIEGQVNTAQAQYKEGNQLYDTYNQDNYGDDTYQGLLSQYNNQLQGLRQTQARRSSEEFQPGQVLESEYAQRYQNMTDFNNQFQSQYQGLMSTIAQLGSLGTELYNRGQARRGELVQSRLTERANYLSQQPEIAQARQSSMVEQRQAGAVQRQRQRTGILSSMR